MALRQDVALFLCERVLPGLEGDIAFEARVPASMLQIVGRELAHRESDADAGLQRLRTLLAEFAGR